VPVPPDHKALLARTNFNLGVKDLSIFSDEEHDFLQRYGHWLLGLAQRLIEPYTDEQVQFVQVSDDKSKPKTMAERAWVKLMMRREYESESHQVIDAFDPAERWFPRHASWIYNQGRYP
jgi:uncharacterized protein YifE (UPF0438 family)